MNRHQRRRLDKLTRKTEVARTPPGKPIGETFEDLGFDVITEHVLRTGGRLRLVEVRRRTSG